MSFAGLGKSIIIFQVVLFSSWQYADACTPKERDTGPGLEIWCCCDASYQRCNAYFVVNGAENGIYAGRVDSRDYCDASGNELNAAGEIQRVD